MSSSSPTSTPTSSGGSGSDPGTPQQTVTIILATTIPAALVILLVSVLCYRLQRKRRGRFSRGLTPINDDEFEQWKVSSRGEEKGSVFRSKPAHQQSDSVGSAQKPASVIVYQNPPQSRGRVSHDQPSWYMHDPDRDIELPATAITARAPNARPGLTDDTIEGDDAYIKRHPARLSKSMTGSPRHYRTRSSRSSTSAGPSREHHTSPRPSADLGPCISDIHNPRTQSPALG